MEEKKIFFFMPFVIGWIIALIASPLVRWLEKRLKIVRKLGTAIIIVAVLALIVLYTGYQWDGVIGMILAIPLGLIVMNLIKAGAFDYIIDDVKILLKGIMSLRE